MRVASSGSLKAGPTAANQGVRGTGALWGSHGHVLRVGVAWGHFHTPTEAPPFVPAGAPTADVLLSHIPDRFLISMDSRRLS